MQSDCQKISFESVEDPGKLEPTISGAVESCKVDRQWFSRGAEKPVDQWYRFTFKPLSHYGPRGWPAVDESWALLVSNWETFRTKLQGLPHVTSEREAVYASPKGPSGFVTKFYVSLKDGEKETRDAFKRAAEKAAGELTPANIHGTCIRSAFCFVLTEVVYTGAAHINLHI